MSDAPAACVIGWPVAHSRSPAIHGFWLQALGLPGRYEREAVPPGDFAAFLGAMPANGYTGGNVTIPHKEAAAALCTELTATARRLGSVNTLWVRDGRLHGDSTDGYGCTAALDAAAPGWDGRAGRAVVLGAGGAARAIVDALHGRGFAEVIVANRSLPRAALLTAALGGKAVPLEALGALLPHCDLLVNTTPAGMAGQPSLVLDLAGLPDHAVVNDIVYVPAETELLAAARARGLQTVGGLGMLLHQAAPGFRRWFGVEPEVTPELRACVEADIAAAAAARR